MDFHWSAMLWKFFIPAGLGSANFLFFDGERLFVHADRRRFETEEGVTDAQRLT